MNTYSFIYIKFLLIFSVTLLFSMHTSAKGFENTDFSISEEGGYFENPISITLTPKNNTEIFWSFFKENPSNLHSTNEISRIYIPRNRNLYVFSKSGEIKKFSFKIQKQQENKYFRFFSLDVNPPKNFVPTVTVENASPFLPKFSSFSMRNWKIKTKNQTFFLPNEELEPGEKRTFVFDITSGEKIFLISPNNRIRDSVLIPSIKKNEIYIRQKASQKILRPQFFIQKK